jgi:fructokinase
MILVCGEALFDFFLEAEANPGAATFAARAGGSPFNVAIGLARLGRASGLLTGLSRDLLGARLARVLVNEGVRTEYALITDRPTTISLVGLDAEGVPAYQFYDAGSAGTGLTEADLPALGPEVAGLHFGSYSIAVPPVADAFAALARTRSDLFVSLDPNIRPTVEPDMGRWRWRLAALLPHADMIKVSSEDLEILYPGQEPASIAQGWLDAGPSLVVVTDGGRAATGWTASGLTASATPPPTRVIDTVGAGDTFQAALLARLSDGVTSPFDAIHTLDQPRLDAMLDYAARAAAITCSRRGADLPRAHELSD